MQQAFGEMTLGEFIAKIYDILSEGDLSVPELWNVGLCFLSSYWFYSHPALFELGKIYRSLNFLADERVWGSLFLLMGILRLYCIYVDHYRSRRNVAAFSFFIWTFFIIVFYISNPDAWILVFIFMTICFSVLEYLRHTDKAEARKRARLRNNLPERP